MFASKSAAVSSCDLALLIRNQVAEVAQNYERSSPYGKRSPLNGNEFEVIGSMVGQRLITLGPEADIFQPIHSFPLIAEIHMFDLFVGMEISSGPWGQADEIVRRLRALSPDSKVEFVDLGFLKTLRHYRTRNGSFDATEFVNVDSKPAAILRVEWALKNGQQITNQIYLHAIDYSFKQSVVANRLKSIGPIDILLVSGSSLPGLETIYSYLDLIKSQGWLVVDIYGPPDAPISRQWQRALGSQFNCHLVPTDMLEQQRLLRFQNSSETWACQKVSP